eukprot:CAMPEP_0173393270 /NCGR_PEP_ID=MMETSP1356-20130122/22017_1 /TAXON_ID=77927 ORGANISM="Hemiselmis virescens, Strain PCC157" /NCGR_SAMPLE_ID=MMETSP1356 /ASSEMBLY_ACC=CAM_ASM_000847 /LENGTH=70 /DNA_ID=CAMNT_0014351269 /DNA_START=475 /DNA_END=687 /DNA_ORIENTATION=+
MSPTALPMLSATFSSSASPFALAAMRRLCVAAARVTHAAAVRMACASERSQSESQLMPAAGWWWGALPRA